MKSRSISHLSALSAGLALALASAGPAQAGTLSLTVGPVPLSPVPFKVCNGDVCVKTPAMSDATLTVEVTPDDLLGVLPAIRLGACPPGQIGQALIVQTNTRGASITGAVNAKIGNLGFKHPIDLSRLGPDRTTVLSLCTF